MNERACIVLTGGPGGGKSTLMRALREADPTATRWLLVPEAAPLLFGAGLRGQDRSFQLSVVRLQVALEESCAAAARDGQFLVCHRGTLDALAYWLRNGWAEDEFFTRTGMSRADHFRRYAGVIHLQTAAVGAEEHYRRWPDAHRPETPEQATTIDELCLRAWAGHSRFTAIENGSRDWPSKARAAHEVLESLVRLWE